MINAIEARSLSYRASNKVEIRDLALNQPDWSTPGRHAGTYCGPKYAPRSDERYPACSALRLASARYPGRRSSRVESFRMR
jgi:hypothetical protein